MDFEIGEKVVLLGGGNLRNTFHVVIYRGRLNDRQAILETDDNLPNPFHPYVTETIEGLPLGGSSWSLAKLNPDYADLALGHYCINGNEIVETKTIR